MKPPVINMPMGMKPQPLTKVLAGNMGVVKPSVPPSPLAAKVDEAAVTEESANTDEVAEELTSLKAAVDWAKLPKNSAPSEWNSAPVSCGEFEFVHSGTGFRFTGTRKDFNKVIKNGTAPSDN